MPNKHIFHKFVGAWVSDADKSIVDSWARDEGTISQVVRRLIAEEARRDLVQGKTPDGDLPAGAD